ncbi:beta-N-acetylhexosaminidase [Arthrobacter sp. ERGS1:01]|nr:beta-N-acetylhexosaminidase [Arthrobacter sp. ERGS1:01]
MVDAAATGASINTMSDLTRYHVGNVYLAGRSYNGVAATAAVVRQMTSTITASTTSLTKLFVATDQEGGYVQVLNGPGFSSIPTGLAQGTIAPSTLTADARAWGNQLRAAGINVDLAPVLDTVTQSFAPFNAPIGYFEREYGYTPAQVSAEGNAFATGLKQAGIAPTAKHFPGLGRVTGNTDTTANVRDTQTTSNDPNLLPFKTAINGGIHFVMVSSAYYSKIDPTHIGPQSQIIMQNLLRTTDHFSGIIISDDLCNAAQLQPWSLGVRANDFFNVGGTMLLCGNERDIPTMYYSLIALAQARPSFMAKINAAALKVLEAKYEL